MNVESRITHGKLEVHVATIAYCWGIDLAMSRIAEEASNGTLQATHRWSPKAEARRWDPLELLRQQDVSLVQRYPGLENVQVVDKLSDASIERLALGHHGTVEPVAEAGNVRILDFTCPFIADSERRAHRLAETGYDLILFGKPGNHHCEYAKGAAEANGRVGVIGESVAEMEALLTAPGRNWACLGQVTANVARWTEFKNDLDALKISVQIVDTVCRDSYERQDEGLRQAKHCDVVILVNDHGGSTTSVFERCVAVNPRTYRFDPMAGDVLKPDWFEAACSVAVVGGIHVPQWILEEVGRQISNLNCDEEQL